ncbi:hypothetical protein C2I18_15775 [Paenibacillus sp. PK3_47]|uniref:HEAT repeat domain-containing protein n=1 Tax=Paenibacillus sp. PK3_47 TaxID=2072642 RepID=UPI00201DD7E9|nr:HEAT repeat domain-containing protein [Paenibacillus sp. PK3_47]UQZ34861.1 hypothetical protein C2I18_15775 [Paenibacillus sp. PK3_47]
MIFGKDLMNKETLLKELDAKGYSGRAHTIAVLGRDHKGSPEYSRLLYSLLAGGVYEAQLALIGAAATQDAQVILSALQHPKASIKNQAAGLAAKVAADEDIERELPKLSQDCRRKLLRTVSFINRQGLAERILPVVYASWGAEEAAILLTACSTETVRIWLQDIGYAVGNWGKLASRHLDAVADYFGSALESAPPRDKGRVWWRFSSAMEMLCHHKPELVLDCAVNHGPLEGLPPALKKHLGILVRLQPDAVYSLLIRSESRNDLLRFGVPDAILRRNKYFTMEQWIGMTKLLADSPVHVARILENIAPSRRAEIFESVYEESSREERVFPEVLLYQLPHALRDREAARMLNLRKIYEYRDKKLRVTAGLSIDKSRELLEQAAAVSNADDRAMAYVQLIKSTALSRRGMKETLLFAGRIKNDQDPVRAAVMRELSHSPASMYTDEDVPALTVLVDSVIEARDTSYATRNAAQDLAFVILRYHAANPGSEVFKFALDTIAKLAKQSGHLALPSLEGNLPSGVEEHLFEKLYTLAADAKRREDYSLVLSLAGFFGKKGDHIGKLQQLLREAVKAKSESTAIRAARLWVTPHQTRDERVKELLGLDKSFITIDKVFEHVHRKRQEWLNPFISGAAVKGKFLSGKTIYLVPAADGFHRWLPGQQESFRSLLDRVASDSKRNLYERITAIKTMGRIPELSPDLLLKYLGDAEIPVVEAALYALSLLEEPDKALPVLLDYLDGDRARVAMYSIPRCIRRVNPETLTAMLQELLHREKLKITVRKEAIRLQGAYKSNESVPLLLNEFSKPNAHKDVIIAVGHAARQLLDDERSWGILSAMAASPQSDIAQSILMQQSAALPEAYRSRYLDLIIAVSGHSDPAVGRLAISSMTRWINGNEETIASAAAEIIVNLEDSSRWNSAVNTLTETCRDGKVNETVIGVFRDLVSAEIADDWNAGTRRDLPHRQRLLRFAGQLTFLPKPTRVNLVSLYMGITGCLQADETLVKTVIDLYIAAIDWNDLEGARAYLDQVVQCTSSQPRLLEYAYQQIAHNLRDSEGYWSPDAILRIVERLGSQGGNQFQYLGLSLLEVAGSALLWNGDSTRLLKLYRTHANVEIRSAALDIWTAVE